MPAPDDPIPTPVIPEEELDNIAVATLGGKMANQNTTVIQAIYEAYDYAITNSPIVNHPIPISEALGILGYSHIFDTGPYHGEIDPYVNAIVYIIEKLATNIEGLKITSEIYNANIALNANQHISFPATKFIRQGLNIKMGFLPLEPDVQYFPLEQVTKTVNINYNTVTQYVPNLETMIDVAPTLTTNVYYNLSNSKLYLDQSFQTFIPDGYYWIPEDYPNAFERRNYVLHIVNGIIQAQLN